MALTLTKEKYFAILLSIFDLGGNATKKDTLDNIRDNAYYHFSSEDLEMKTNRPELHWRNDFAFVRKQLVQREYIDGSQFNQWAITQEGIEYLFSLCKTILSSDERVFQRLTKNATKRAMSISWDFDKNHNELVEDQMIFPNETQDLLIKKIKRYKKVVDELKEEYKGQCQIENCGFTFVKSNGDNYAEGHHLIPLAEGGSQDKQNVVILCANHHRMFHYANVEIRNFYQNKRSVTINGIEQKIVY